MAPYIFYTFVIITLSSVDVLNTSLTVKRIAHFLIVTFTIIFVGFRHEIGNDWNVYRNMYEEILSTGKSDEKMEIGFKMMNLVCAKVGFGFNSFVFILASISIALKAQILKTLTDKYSIALLYYLAYFLTEYEMSGVRQALALAFAWIAIPSIINRDFKKFLLIVILGSTIHISILFFLPAYGLFKLRLSTRSSLLLMMLSISFIMFNVSSLLLTIVGLVPGAFFVLEKLQSYSVVAGANTGLTVGHLIYLSIGAIFIFFRQGVKNVHYDFYLNLFLFGLAASFLFSGSLAVLNRATYYYLSTGGILFSMIIMESRQTMKTVVFLFLAALFVIKIFESILDPSFIDNYVPYRFCLL